MVGLESVLTNLPILNILLRRLVVETHLLVLLPEEQVVGRFHGRLETRVRP
jgi:hypothetical protein